MNVDIATRSGIDPRTPHSSCFHFQDWPPRTPEFRAAQFRQRGESICGRNEQITIIKYKTENLRGKTDYKNEKKYEK